LSASVEASYCDEQGALSVDNVAYDFDQLLSMSISISTLILTDPSEVYNYDWTRSRSYFYKDLRDSSDDINCVFKGEPRWEDTDDKVEEANAADNGIKIIEGDW
jgi:hypothetical protein